MYALREAVGEEAVNRALSKFVRDHRYSCTIAQELVRYKLSSSSAARKARAM
jgi:hypothetical protein